MKPKQLQEVVDELFWKVVDLDVDAQRKFLEEACVPSEVRCEVDELLLADRHICENSPSAFATGGTEVHGLLRMVSTAETITRQLAEEPPARTTKRHSQEGNTQVLAPGETIGKFQLLQLLGSGSYGDVWSAHDTVLDRKVALKLPRHGANAASNKILFAREARAASRFQHTHLVRVLEVLEEADSILIASELVDGITLSEWIATKKLTVRQSAELCVKLADAIEHAHSHGVIHRDLKPANILMDQGGEPHITDFGMAKRDCGEATLTISGDVLGTPSYMPPEQARGDAHAADERSDVYSLGVILFQLLTGELPFRGDSRTVVQKVISEESPSPRSFAPLIPLDIETICLKCLEKSPSRRFQSAAELADELKRWLGNRPILARPIGRFGRFLRLCERHPVVASLCLMIGVLLLSGLTSVTFLWLQANQNRMVAEEHLSRRTVNFDKTISAIERMLSRIIENESPDLTETKTDLLNESIKLYQELLQEESTEVTVLSENARARMRIGNLYELLSEPKLSISAYEAAIVDFEKALEIAPQVDHASELAESYRSLGNVLLTQKVKSDRDWDTCKKSIQRSLEISTKGMADSLSRDISIASSEAMLIHLFSAQGRIDEAIKQSLKVVKLKETVLARDPSSLIAFNSLAWAKHELADLLIREKRYSQAIPIHQEVIAMRRDAFKRFPDSYSYHPSSVVNIPSNRITRFCARSDLAANYRSIGNAFSETGDLMAAKTAYHEALALFEKVVKDYPHRDFYQSALAGIHARLAQTYLTLAAPDDALRHLEEAINIRVKIPNLMESPNELRILLQQHSGAAALARQVGLNDIELAQSRGAFECYEKLRGHPQLDCATYQLAANSAVRIAALLEQSTPAEAQSARQAARAVADDMRGTLSPTNETQRAYDAILASIQKAENQEQSPLETPSNASP